MRFSILILTLFISLSSYSLSSSHSVDLEFHHKMRTTKVFSMPNRMHLSAKVWGIFFSPRSTQAIENSVLQSYYSKMFQTTVFHVIENLAVFGGPCSRYKNESYNHSVEYPSIPKKLDFVNGCPSGYQDNMPSQFLSDYSILRERTFAEVCNTLVYSFPEELKQTPLSDSILVENALSIADLKVSSSINKESVRAAWMIFNSGREPTAKTVDALLDFSSKNTDKSLKNQWKTLTYALCRSADFNFF